MTEAFDARSYWESRLADDWSLETVGLRRLGHRWNIWAYRVRRDVFLDVVRRHLPDLAHATVLDVGSGTGFYIDRWREAGAAAVSALDLTDAAVHRLRDRYPTVDVHRVDIGEAGNDFVEEHTGDFDAVSAMDVFFHIVDDRAFAQALANVHQLLRPGGTFVWSDAFNRFAGSRVEHRASRTLADIERLLNDAGFTVERRTPMFVLMNDPVDLKHPWAAWPWRAVMGLASLAEPLGGMAGWMLYPVESRLVRRRDESPTTEIMICRST